ncbi:[LysW]-aminoadipate kinase [Candidatus Uabimicrobium sp. HlEnr_7]|uniref:[LysW]-aminoadipate kinase n=1 Tax=Candidatus Uabimicrobium helgolandensis TaxID=3095367 RepID=UPI0035565E18
MIVVKVGGSEGIDLDALCADFASLVAEGKKIILVHGGSHQTNVIAEKLGYPPKFITSPSGYTSRLTDRKTLEIFEMVYCGEINKGIVERLQKHGVNAVGLSGIDGRMWEGPRKKAVRAVENGKVRVVRNNLTGVVEKVNTSLLESLLGGGHLPVLCPPAISYEGEAINVDGDRAAGQTAIALKAEVLLLLSNVPGLLREFPDESSLISEVKFNEIANVEKYAQGRMRMKVLGAKEALAGGVGKVIMGDARVENSIRKALEGYGTTFTK